MSGKITFNGEERNNLAYRKVSCYIPQDFALLDLLTVQETMSDSVDLKLPSKTTSEEKEKIVRVQDFQIPHNSSFTNCVPYMFHIGQRHYSDTKYGEVPTQISA